MSVIIKRMEMPRCCAECDAEGHYEDSYGDKYGFFCPFGYKAYTRETRELKRLDDCPLVPVPDHGRLIDADALCEGLVSNHEVVIYAKSAPTIIPADRGDENG